MAHKKIKQTQYYKGKAYYRLHRKKIKYLIVGGWNTLVGYGLFAALYAWLNPYTNYMVVLIISNVISITNAYVGYKFFVFKTKGNYLKEYLRFYMVYATGFFINLVILPLIINFTPVNVYLAQALITGLIIIMSYIGHNKFSFNHK